MPVYEYQKAGIAKLLPLGGTLLADEPGMGKTCQALTALKITDAFPAIVITPKSVRPEWVREAKKWCPAANPVVISGTPAQRSKQFDIAVETENLLLIVSWDNLRQHSRLAAYGGKQLVKCEKCGGDAKIAACEAHDLELQQFSFKTVIADEGHRAKDPKSKWTRALWALGDQATYRWVLTATPIGNEHADLWATFRFMEPDMFPSKSKFVDRYIDHVELPWARSPIGLKQENRDEFNEILDAYMIRRTAAEIPELRGKVPQLVEMRRDVELTPKQKAAYKSMKKELLAQIGDEILTADNPLVLRSRLRYIASAMPQMDSEGGINGLELPSNKLTELEEMLHQQEIPLPAVVFTESSKLARLAYTYISFSKKVKLRTEIIDGSVSAPERERIIAEFQDGKIDVLFGTMALAEGVNLQRGAAQVFLQIPSSLIKWEQSCGRVPRLGNPRPLIPNFLLLSPGTTDEVDYNTIVAKTERLEDIVRDKARIFGTL